MARLGHQLRRPAARLSTFLWPRQQARNGFFWSRQQKPDQVKAKSFVSRPLTGVAISALLIYSLYPTDVSQHLATKDRTADEAARAAAAAAADDTNKENEADQTAWNTFASSFEGLSSAVQFDASKLSDTVVDLFLPEWSKNIPAYVRKLQRELNMEPGSLADEIWREAHDPTINPEINYAAKVRVSEHLCDDEQEFLSRRRKVTAVALAKYLGIDEKDVHPDDVPVIAVSSSGGGLRALVAGTGSYLATAEDGLFDCVTYMSGVSGSCWLQSLFYSSITGGDLHRAIDHLKARINLHIAYPPAAFNSLISAPTNKYLLSGMMEKAMGNPDAGFGLVDAYGTLLAARLLVPKGELGVNERDFKLSNQKKYIQYGQNPLPIYTAVRHEIPEIGAESSSSSAPPSEAAKDRAKKEAWFQWFEITPYEFFSEEFAAGIPTWAMGRRFSNGVDQPTADGFRPPEIRIPLLMGIWGSAFCATLSHYYREVRPLVQSLAGLGAVDDLIWGHNEDLSKVHPIDPATLPNFVHGMQGKLPATVPAGVYNEDYIQLMDAGMSNNLPIYPLLRPGRNVDVLVAFDASADIKTGNWLSVVDGYARQRGIKGWPVGIGWPKESTSPATTARELDKAEGVSSEDAEVKLAEAKLNQAARRAEAGASRDESDGDRKQTTEAQRADQTRRELGYCTVWVGTTQERSSGPPPPPIDDMSTWQLMEPDAGLAVVYLPFLANEKVVPGVDPAVSDYMSTWNFVYTPEQIDGVVALARANYEEGKGQIRATVRAVYERKKKRREEREGGEDERGGGRRGGGGGG
ncbi:acyl transferase/acyl hydrolase/lysophospholipase [Bombardia bombarda]|uniref:Lysophospholipase n=1 Tax=Bombardia bombarda TaxID=252184 RepID=A0AA40CHD2_9PEZI|nr:acyl transferase/acyl hydrolase/lysophospholipase [Bombardia bombarda]